MDFALQQLIADTGDVRSALRGHSLAPTCSATTPATTVTSPATPPAAPPSPSSTSSPWPIPADSMTSRPISRFPPLIRRSMVITSPAGSSGYRTPAATIPLVGSTRPSRSSTTTPRHTGDQRPRPSTAPASMSSGSRLIDATTALDNPTAAAQSGLCSLAELPGLPPQGRRRTVHPGWPTAPRLQRTRHGGGRLLHHKCPKLVLRQLPLQRLPP